MDDPFRTSRRQGTRNVRFLPQATLPTDIDLGNRRLRPLQAKANGWCMTLRYLTPLSADEQLAQGLAVPQTLALADKVRFAELDVLRHVNNKAYMTWFETLRVEYFRLFGTPNYDPDSPPPRIVLHSGTVRYVREMRLGEDYVATARVIAFRRTSCTLDQQLWAGGTLRATFICVIAFRQPDGSGGYPLPDALRQRFLTIDGAKDEAASA
jgi:acyl-CoA thioester hydrolase